jgi:ABC-type phosphate transport system permease subunit
MKWILLALIGIVLFLVWHAYTIFGEEEPNKIMQQHWPPQPKKGLRGLSYRG